MRKRKDEERGTRVCPKEPWNPLGSLCRIVSRLIPYKRYSPLPLPLATENWMIFYFRHIYALARNIHKSLQLNLIIGGGGSISVHVPFTCRQLFFPPY